MVEVVLIGWIWVAVLLGCTLRSVLGINVTVGVLLPDRAVPATVDACPTLSSARAEEELVKEQTANSHPQTTLQFSYHNTNCSDYYGPIVAMEIFYLKSVNVLYGPCCKFTLSPVGRYAKHWKLPIVTPGGLVDAFANRDNFPYVTRLTGSYVKLADFFKTHVTERYGWTRLSFIYHENFGDGKTDHGRSPCSFAVASIRKALVGRQQRANANAAAAAAAASSTRSEAKSRGYDFNPNMFDEDSLDDLNWPEILNTVTAKSRGK